MMKLLIADDHVLVRDALKSHIESLMPDAVVETAGDVDGVMALIDRSPDAPFSMIILDLIMPGMEELNGLIRVKNATTAPIAIMSGLAGPGDAEAVVDAGAACFLPKTLAGSSLIEVFRQWCDHEDGTVLTENSAPVLTRRETAVVEHLLLGMSNKEIARCLDVEEVTVKLHVRNICRKLQAKNRTHAALQALRLGFQSASFPDHEETGNDYRVYRSGDYGGADGTASAAGRIHGDHGQPVPASGDG